MFAIINKEAITTRSHFRLHDPQGTVASDKTVSLFYKILENFINKRFESNMGILIVILASNIWIQMKRNITEARLDDVSQAEIFIK